MTCETYSRSSRVKSILVSAPARVASFATTASLRSAVGSATVPGVAFGPGDPSVAGTPGEFVPTAQLTQSEFVLRQWLTAPD